MNFISPIIRIVCGLVLVVAAATRYFSVRAQIAEADGGDVQILGFNITGEPWQLGFAFGAACIFGIVLVGLGGFALLKKLQEN